VAPKGFRQVHLQIESGDEILWISDDNAGRLRSLKDVFEMVWATGWGHHANRVMGPLHQLDELPVVELEFSDEPTWKLPSIKAYVGDHRPFAWIDDDFRDDAWAWAERRPGPTLLAECEPHVGLTDDIVHRCLEFARRCPPNSRTSARKGHSLNGSQGVWPP
jgi:hypothetical protein